MTPEQVEATFLREFSAAGEVDACKQRHISELSDSNVLNFFAGYIKNRGRYLRELPKNQESIRRAYFEAFRRVHNRIVEAMQRNTYELIGVKRDGSNPPAYNYLICENGRLIGRFVPSFGRRDGYRLEDRVGARVFYVSDPERPWDKTTVTAKTKSDFLTTVCRWRDCIRSQEQIDADAAAAAAKKAADIAAEKAADALHSKEKRAAQLYDALAAICEIFGPEDSVTIKDAKALKAEIDAEIARNEVAVDAENAR